MSAGIAFRTILGKEIVRFTRIWPQTLLPPAVTTALYFLIFGKLIGGRVGSVNGETYMDYIVPGVILMSVISSSYANVVSSFYSTKFQHHIEELLVAPVPNRVILAGYVLGGVARGVMAGCIVAAIAALFTRFPVKHWEIAVATLLMTATLFALAGFINAVFANSFDAISIIPNFVLTPLSYLGGVFYSVSMLPGVWRYIAQANPILYMVNAFRYGLIGVTDVDVNLAFAITLSCILLLIVTGLLLLHKGIGIKN